MKFSSIFFICSFPVLTLILFLSNEQISNVSAIYPYTIKGYVQDVRHRPGLLIGGWALKKALKLKKLKLLIALKIKLKLKLLAKKLLFKFLLGRKRRSLAGPIEDYETSASTAHEIDLPDNMIPEIHENDIMPYYVMASEFDQDGCLPKSICDVMARNRTGGFNSYSSNKVGSSELSPFEKMITEDYMHVQRPEDTTSPSFVYEYAAYYGRNSKSLQACSSLFSTCREDPFKLNKIMDGSYRTDICDSPDEVEYYSPQQQLLYHDVLPPPPTDYHHQQYSQQQQQQQDDELPALLAAYQSQSSQSQPKPSSKLRFQKRSI